MSCTNLINREVLDTITIINTVKASYFLEWSRSGIFSRSYLWRGALEWSGKIFWEGRDKRSLLQKKWSISKSGDYIFRTYKQTFALVGTLNKSWRHVV